MVAFVVVVAVVVVVVVTGAKSEIPPSILIFSRVRLSSRGDRKFHTCADYTLLITLQYI